MPPTPLISAIVLNYNGVGYLHECFASLVRLDYPRDRLELILVDNASTDTSVAVVRESFPEVRIVQLNENRGFGGGNNVGAAEARGEYVVFLNNDMRVQPELLLGFLEALGSGINVVAAGAKILNWDGTAIDFGGAAMHFAGMAYQVGFQEAVDTGRFTEIEPILFACAGAMIIDREVFLEVGGFDADFFAFFEDTDLGWRLWILGHEVVFAPRAMVHHRHHGTTGRLAASRKLVLYKRNSLASVYKNYGDRDMGRMLSAALLGTVDSVVTSATQRGALDLSRYEIDSNKRQSRGVTLKREEASTLVAIHELVTQLPTLSVKRELIQTGRKRSDSEIASLFRWPLKLWTDVTPKTQSAVIEGFAVDDLFAGLPRRIVVLSPDAVPYPGLATVGSGLRAWGLVQGLSARGHDVVLCVPRQAIKGLEDVVPHEALQRAWDRSNIAEVVKREDPDLIVACGWPVLNELPVSQFSVPIILDQAGPHFLERRFQRYSTEDHNRDEKFRAFRKADVFTSSGEKQHEYFRQWLTGAGWSETDIERRSHVIPFSMPPDLPDRRPSQELTFVYGGVFLPWQDPTIGLETVTAELERRGEGVLHLFGGHHSSGSVAEHRVSGLYERLGASERVVRHELQPFDTVTDFYSRAHVAIDLMAYNEERALAFTTRTVVYLWCGLPVIYNDYSELSDYIADYDAGWTVDPTDVDAIRAIIDEIFDDPTVVVRKSENARRLVRQRLDWTRTIEPLDDFARHPSVRLSREIPIEFTFYSSLVEKVRWTYRNYGAAEVARRSLRLAKARVMRR